MAKGGKILYERAGGFYIERQKKRRDRSLRLRLLTDLEQVHRHAGVVEGAAARNEFEGGGRARHRKDDRGGLGARLVCRRKHVLRGGAVQRRAVQAELQQV